MDNEVFSLEDDGYGDLFITQESKSDNNSNGVNDGGKSQGHVLPACSPIYEDISDDEDAFEKDKNTSNME